MFRCASARTLESFFGKKKERSRDARYHVSQQAHRIARPVGPKFPLPGGQSQSGGGCRTTEEEASVRGLRSKGPQEQRSLQSLLAALGSVRCPELSSLLDPASGLSALWRGQRKGALGRQGEPLYQELRTRGSVAGTEDGRQRRSELFPSDVAFGATDHPAGGCRATG